MGHPCARLAVGNKGACNQTSAGWQLVQQGVLQSSKLFLLLLLLLLILMLSVLCSVNNA